MDTINSNVMQRAGERVEYHRDLGNIHRALRETDPHGAMHMDIVGVSNEFFDLLRPSRG